MWQIAFEHHVFQTVVVAQTSDYCYGLVIAKQLNARAKEHGFNDLEYTVTEITLEPLLDEFPHMEHLHFNAL